MVVKRCGIWNEVRLFFATDDGNVIGTFSIHGDTPDERPFINIFTRR